MRIDIHLVPWDSAHRGLRMGAGPEHLIASGLPARLERLGHQVEHSIVEPVADGWRAEIATAFDLAAVISARVSASRRAEHFPLVLAGNCMSTLGVVAGLGAGTGVLWFDAHGDFNTPDITTGGFLDGMAIATLTGRCWMAMAADVPGFIPVPEKDVWLLGARDFDLPEADALRQSAVRHLPVHALGAGLGAAVRREMSPEQVHVHLDMDVLDPGEGRVNRYAAPGGLSAVTLASTVGSLGGLASSMTVSAYDPAYDADGRVCEVALRTLEAFFTESAPRS